MIDCPYGKNVSLPRSLKCTICQFCRIMLPCVNHLNLTANGSFLSYPSSLSISLIGIGSMFKMPFTTRHFNKNQKVWVEFTTGAEAACVIGKFRGKGRYVRAWVNWRSKGKAAPDFKEIEVEESFARRIGCIL